MDSDAEELIVGTVLRPHGVRGMVKVRPESDRPERFGDLRRVMIRLADGHRRTLHLSSYRVSGAFVIVAFDEIRDRDEAELLRAAEICVEAREAVPLETGEFFAHDLVGCEVVGLDGYRWGVVEDVLETAAHGVLVLNDDETMIPFVRAHIERVDLASGTILVTWPGGAARDETAG